MHDITLQDTLSLIQFVSRQVGFYVPALKTSLMDFLASLSSFSTRAAMASWGATCSNSTHKHMHKHTVLYKGYVNIELLLKIELKIGAQ